MKVRLSHLTMSVLIALMAFMLCEADVQGQQQQRRRARRPSRRITNPVTPRRTEPPLTGSTADAQIISTAEDTAEENTTGERTTNQSRRRRGEGSAPETEQERMQRTVNTLSAQVTQLSDEMRRMQEQQRTIINLERLTRAEERAENMRSQLRDVSTRESDLQARLEAIEYELQSDSIERRVALSGSRRPEDTRVQIRRQLESERERARAQLSLLTGNRARLESAIASADTEVERVRSLVNEPSSDLPSTDPTSSEAQTTAPTPNTAPTVSPTTSPNAPPSPPGMFD